MLSVSPFCAPEPGEFHEYPAPTRDLYRVLWPTDLANYGSEKLLALLKGSEFDSFVEHIKPQLAAQKKFGGGKNIAAIEKVVYGNPHGIPSLHTNNLVPHHTSQAPLDTSAAPTPPLVSGDGPSPQSSSVPSTNASSIAERVDSRKSSASNTVEVMTPTST